METPVNLEDVNISECVALAGLLAASGSLTDEVIAVPS